ncbi:MAG: site-2 protease family protein [Deltaproteobacteria bacterium]|nr:site-2 protease family protein [Deltaproteobacteria bacterium]
MEIIVQKIVIYAAPILFGLTFHEYAHGLMADRLGDPTPRNMGRLTLNPVVHLDPIGTMVFFVTQAFGWARPISINPGNLNSPRRDLMWIALAGPLANFLLALFCALLYHLFRAGSAVMGEWLLLPCQKMAVAGVVVNLSLGLINLIPIPPLDGGRILAGILPERPAGYLAKIDSYGTILLLILVLSDSLSLFLWPLLSGLTSFLLYGVISF